jgi:PAS domain S-box-containing protein
MKSRRSRFECTTALRQQAETVVHNNSTPSRAMVAAMSPEAIWGLLFELRVRQIELELQNDDLRRAQQALDVSHERYFDLYELAPVAYLTLNEAGFIEQANLTVTNMLGYCRKALLNQAFARFIYEEDKDVFLLQRRQLLIGGELQTFELRLLRPDGALCWCGVSCGLAQEGNRFVFRVVLTDISQLKSVADPSGKIALAVEQNPESIRIADPQAHFDFVNDAMLGASGRYRNELPGNHQQHLHARKTARGRG